MAYTVNLKRSAEKELEKLPTKIHDKIINILLSLKENPFPRNSKKLRGREGYRIRVGDYRILYLIDESGRTMEVVSVAHRKEVYRY
jgi:mRNA interferase RelE/StbE